MTILTQLRRLTVFAAVAALLIGAFSVMAVAMPSDLDGDGDADTADARLLLLSLVDEQTLTEEQILAADLNGDGQVTSADARLLLTAVLQTPVTTTPTAVTSTMPPVETTNTTTTTTFIPTTTTTWVLTGPDGTAPTTMPTTIIETTTVRTTYTTMPSFAFTVSMESQVVRAGDTFEVPVYITEDHALVGFEMEIYYDPSMLTPIETNDSTFNPYATTLHPAVFDDNAAWRFTKINDGLLNVRYVSSADNGSREGGVLFTLTFLLDDDAEYSTGLMMYMPLRLCCSDGVHTNPFIKTDEGDIIVRSRTTRPSTTLPTTTDTTNPPTTDTTYPPTTTSTWVLTGPDGTAPTTMPTTTTTRPGCISTPATTYPTTLPYGDPLNFTGETVTARVGDTFTWTISVSERHSLVGLRLAVIFDPTVLTWDPAGTLYNGSIFNEQSEWRLVQIDEGMLELYYVSTADTGDYDGGQLITLTFRLREDVDVDVDETYIYIDIGSWLSAVNGFAYETPFGVVTDGTVKVASRTTRPKFTTTTAYEITDPTTTTVVYDQ